jgi:teichuronic acid biosynthesis glycosyltransferase TuaC
VNPFRSLLRNGVPDRRQLEARAPEHARATPGAAAPIRPDGGREPRVLVLSSVYPTPARPSYGVFVHERARHVAQGCDMVVVAPVLWFPFNRFLRGRDRATAPRVEHRDGVTVYHPRVVCVPGVAKCLDGWLYFLSLVPFVRRLRREFPFDVIDAHFSYPDGLAGVLLGRLFRRPVLVTLRGSHDLRQAASTLRRPQVRFALRAAARVLTVSRSLAQFAVGLGVPADHVQVVPNGVDDVRFGRTDRAEARRALDLPGDRSILLTVGTLVENKGHHHVLDVLPELVARRGEVLLVIVGGTAGRDGYRRRLEEAVARHRLHDHVRIVGSQPHDEIPRWLAAADVFCLATRVEGWCNAIMEALACGVPVVTTAVGGNGELVRQGVDGFLVPYWDRDAFRDSVLSALEQPWDREAISRRARAGSWGRTASEVLDAFQSAMAGPDPAPAMSR